MRDQNNIIAQTDAKPTEKKRQFRGYLKGQSWIVFVEICRFVCFFIHN